MKFSNPTYKTKKVKTFLVDLIHDYDYKSYDDLCFSDKCELVSLILEALERNGDHEFFVESNDMDSTLIAFRKSLNGTTEDDENFLEAMKEHAVRYYDQSMELLFQEQLDDYLSEKHEWRNYVSKYGDPDDAYDRYREGIL